MEKTYLVFFGKPSDFKYVVFDNQQEIKNFDTVISNFGELESQMFMIENAQNKPILAKYRFDANNKRYSLLKLYSYAQNSEGTGNMFGVAFLSEGDIAITRDNIENLKGLKNFFSHVALSEGKMFKSRNFSNEVNPIWTQFANKGGFTKIDFISENKFYEAGTKGFYVKNVVNAKNVYTEKVYFSEDLEHLKRTSKKWGKDKFPIYEIDTTGKIIEYNEKEWPVEPKITKPENTQDNTNQQGKIDGANYQQDFENLQKKIEKLTKLVIAAVCTSAACVLLSITFFFGTSSSFDKWKTSNKNSQFSKKNPQNDETAVRMGKQEGEAFMEEQKGKAESSDNSMVDNSNSAIRSMENDTQITLNPQYDKVGKGTELRPQIRQTSNKYRIRDIVWSCYPEGLVKIDEKGVLEVISRPNEDTRVTITATLEKYITATYTITVVKK